MADVQPACLVQRLEGVVCLELVDAVIVDDAVVGRIDAAARQALAVYPKDGLLIDFRNVTYVSSAVFGRLISLNRLSKARGECLRVCGMSPMIRQMFAVTQLDQLFEFFDDRDAAVRHAG